MKQLWIGVGAMALAGCAVQKPVLPDSEYAPLVQRWVGVHVCADKGMIDADTAARGRRYFQSDFDSVTFDPARVSTLVSQMSADTSGVSSMFCSQLAVVIAGRKQQIEAHNEMVNRDIQQTNQTLSSQQNKQVFYNTVGGVTMCNNGI